MIRRFAAIALLVCFALGSLCVGADPATKPLSPSLPTPSPAKDLKKTLQSTTKPGVRATSQPALKEKKDSTKSKVEEKLTDAQRLVREMKARAEAEAKLYSVAYFDLDQPVQEKAPTFTLFGDNNVITIHSLMDRLHKARDDKSLKAVLINFGDTGFSFSQAQEIRGALIELRKAGKRTFVYSDAYDTPTYTAACGATDICMLGGGEMMMPGVGLETMFYKGLFDKLGVGADYVQIGEYKGAQEPYTRTAPTEELRGELNKLVDSLYVQIIDGIAENRNISKDTVKTAIDEAIITAKDAKEYKLVDHLVDQDELRPLIKDELGHDIKIVDDYGAPQQMKPDFSNPLALLQMLSKKPEVSGKPAVALIHAEGEIVDGSAEDSLFGGGDTIGGEDIRKAFRQAVQDEHIKAIVLRIDSPGGSALASEVMWQAARHAAESKPLIVSVGSMAASGGYYLASSGDYIFADPSAIVGSIGVVGGKFVLKDLFNKVGLSTEEFTRGRNADLFSSNQPFSDRQRRMVTNWMRQTYDQFTERVMTNRAGKIKDIDAVARGRIFLAKQAKDLGMVDELGGLEDAIAHAASEADLKPGQYEVRTVPAPHTLADMFNGGDGSDAAMPFRPKISISPDSLLLAAPEPMRKLITQQLRLAEMLQRHPVVLMSPFVLSIK